MHWLVGYIHRGLTEKAVWAFLCSSLAIAGLTSCSTTDQSAELDVEESPTASIAHQPESSATKEATGETWSSRQADLMAAVLLQFDLSFYQKQYNEHELAIEESIESCMRENGFEYYPNVTLSTTTFKELDRVDSRETRSIDGWGISQSWLSPLEAPNEGDERNYTYISQLTESGTAAYIVAFDKCSQLAAGELEGQDPNRLLSEESLQFYQEIVGRITVDPEYSSLIEDWTVCMADEGFEPVPHPDNVFGLFNETASFDRILSEIQPIAQEMGDRFDPSVHLDDELREVIQESVEREVIVAVADWDCQGGSGDKISKLHRRLVDEYGAETYKTGSGLG